MHIDILDSAGNVTRLNERIPGQALGINVFEGLSFESVNPGGFTVANFVLHRKVTQYWPDLLHRNQIKIGEGAEVYWEGYIDKPTRSIRPDVIEVNCLGWSAELNQLWTTSDITAPSSGYKMSTFINTVFRANIGQQIFCMDGGTTAVLDAIHNLPATVSRTPTFATLMGVQAPVITPGTTNKLSAVNSSFETGVGNWVGYWGPCTLSSSTDWADAGTHSLKIVPGGGLAASTDVTSVTNANAVYVFSLKFKGVAGKLYWLGCWDDVRGAQGQLIPATGTGALQTLTFTIVFGACTARQISFMSDSTSAGEVAYVDSVTVVDGPPKISFDTASLGITPGMPISIVCVVKPTGAWDDGLNHLMYCNISNYPAGPPFEGFEVFKSIYGTICVNSFHGMDNKSTALAATSTNWAPNVTHVVIATIDAANNQRIFVDGVEGTWVTGSCARETAVGANSYIGIHPDDVFSIDGPELCAIYGQVLSDDEIALVNSTTLWTDMIDLAEPSTHIVTGTIETGDYAYPVGTRFEFAPATYYSNCIEQFNAGNNYNWGVWGNKTIDLRAKTLSVIDWYVWTRDCEDLSIGPNPDKLCNHCLVNYTQDGSHYEQTIVEDLPSQLLYGVHKVKVDIPGKIITAGAFQIGVTYVMECKDLEVAAEFTCNRIFDSYGAEQPLGKVRGGENVRIVDWMPTEELLTGVNDIATFQIKSAKYDHSKYTLDVTPTEFMPSTEIQIARLQAVGY